MEGSTVERVLPTEKPSLSTFDPRWIPYQYHVLKSIRNDFSYAQGMHEIMLSGSVGSAKSILMAHLIVTHCLQNKGARFCIGRNALPDLKSTLCQEIYDHISPDLVEGKHFEYHRSTGNFEFANGSSTIARSWADGNFKKARSLALSGFGIEEITENDSQHFSGFYPEYAARVGRISHIKENFIIGATNPDGPSHAAYEYFILPGTHYRSGKVIKAGQNKHRHVFFSVTSENPFLPKHYTQRLLDTYTKEETRRMIFGEWLEIRRDVIYYAYDESISIIPSYRINPLYPIYIAHDFNIGVSKPMSCALFQKINGCFIFFAEVVVQGARTEDIYDELLGRGFLKTEYQYIIMGDASGRSGDTRSKRSDYDIINDYLRRLSIEHEIDVPLSNPPVRTRHSKVNGQLKNAEGRTHVKIVESCEVIRKGFRLSRLKEGSGYTEDDGPKQPWQHISTACGYGICRVLSNEESSDSLRKIKL